MQFAHCTCKKLNYYYYLGNLEAGSAPALCHILPIPEQFLQWDSKRCWGSLPFASLVSFTLTQGSPAEHCTVMRRSMLLTSPVSDFNDVAGWFTLVRWHFKICIFGSGSQVVRHQPFGQVALAGHQPKTWACDDLGMKLNNQLPYRLHL